MQPIFDSYDVGGQCDAVYTGIGYNKAGLNMNYVLPRLAFRNVTLICRGTAYGDDADLGNWIMQAT